MLKSYKKQIVNAIFLQYNAYGYIFKNITVPDLSAAGYREGRGKKRKKQE